MSTKIHATVDALGNPTGFHLTSGQEHDLAGADALLPELEAETLIADKAFDADQRVLEPLAEAGKTAVIPPRTTRKTARAFDKDLYKARTSTRRATSSRTSLPSSSSSGPLPLATTRPRKVSWPAFTWPPLSSGSKALIGDGGANIHSLGHHPPELFHARPHHTRPPREAGCH